MPDEQYITLGEIAGLVAAYVAPILLVAGIVQFRLLRPLKLLLGWRLGVLFAAAVITLLFTWGLLYVVPPVFGYSLFGSYELGLLGFPALIAAFAVTACVALYSLRKPRGPAADRRDDPDEALED